MRYKSTLIVRFQDGNDVGGPSQRCVICGESQLTFPAHQSRTVGGKMAQANWRKHCPFDMCWFTWLLVWALHNNCRCSISNDWCFVHFWPPKRSTSGEPTVPLMRDANGNLSRTVSVPCKSSVTVDMGRFTGPFIGYSVAVWPICCSWRDLSPAINIH